MGYFIKHLVGSEPRTHRGGGKAAVRALLKASAVLRRGAVDGVGSTGVGVEEEERGAGNGWRGVEIWIISTRGGLLYQTSSLSILIRNRQ